MRNSKRNGFIKSLTSVIAVVLMLALMLTGCTDKEAQSLANTAQGVADKAQTSADEANKNATSAQDKAESNLAKLTELEKLVMSLPDSEAVATAIANALADYVKGDGALAKDSIVTYEEVKSLLAQYVTAQALEEKLTGVGTDLATLKTKIEEELGKAINKNADDIKTVNAWINGAAATIVASNEFKTAINTALSDYITKTVFDEGIKSVNDKIAALQKLLVGANYDVTSAENLIGQINEDLADLTTKLAAVEAKVDVELKVSEAIAAAKVELESAIKNKYLAATEFIIENDYKFDDLLEEYEAKKNIYNEETYNALIKNINDNRVRFRRSLVVDCGQEHDGDRCCAVKILETVTSASAEQINLAQALAAALDEVQYVNGYVVIEDLSGSEYADKNSKTGLEKANSILETINAQMTAEEFVEYVNSYNDASTGKVRDLKEEVDVLSAEVAKLEAIKTYAAANVITKFTAISNYDATAKNFASIKVDMAKKYLGVDSNRDTLEAEKLVADQARDRYVASQFGYDDDNPNIERLITAAAWEQYYAANTRINELQALDAKVADYVTKITTALANAYDIDAGAGTAHYLYNEYGALNNLKIEIDGWIAANFSSADNAADVITNYDDDATATTNDLDLVAAVAYAKAMTEKFTVAHKENDGLVAKIDAILAKDISIKFLDEYNTAYDEFQTWKTGVDDKNVEAIINYVEVATLSAEGRLAQFEALKAKYDALKTAQENIDDVNGMIADLVALMNNGKLNINSMGMEDGIREVRNEIVKWLNAGQIAVPDATDANKILVDWIKKSKVATDVPYEVDASYVAANWNMLDSDEFISVINAYNAIAKKALDAATISPDAENFAEFAEDFPYGGPVYLIGLINTTDGKILYQKDAIDKAIEAYSAWIRVFEVGVVHLETLDLGESYDSDLIYDNVNKMVNANTLYNETLNAAKAAHDLFKDALASAIAGKATVQAADIPTAYKAATEWANKYTDTTRGFNDAINALDLLTGTEYTTIQSLYEQYEKLVAEAIKDAEAVKNAYAPLDPMTVYSYGAIADFSAALGDWARKYEITLNKDLFYTNANLDARLKGVVDGVGIDMVVYNCVDDLKGEYFDFIEEVIAKYESDVKDMYDYVNADEYVFTIYSGEDVAKLREVYNKWADFAGLKDYTADAYTAAINDKTVAGYKAVAAFVKASEDKVLKLENDKKAETTAVQAVIDKLAELDADATKAGIQLTTQNRATVEAARKLYEQWLKGDFNHNDIVDADETFKDLGIYVVYKIESHKNNYVVNIAKLLECEAALDAIDDLIVDVDDAIAALEDGATQNEIDAVKKALEDLAAANGGAFNGAVSFETMVTIEQAEMALAYDVALTDAAAKEAELGATAYAALVKQLKDTYDTYTNELLSSASTKAAFESGDDDAYEIFSTNCKEALTADIAEAVNNIA